MAENYDRQTLHRRSSPEAASRFLGVPGLGSVEGTDLRVLTEWRNTTTRLTMVWPSVKSTCPLDSY